LLGDASFGALDWAVGEVRRYSAAVELLQRSGSDAPRYVADDGCVCIPGRRLMGTGSQSGCDLDVITSFDRLQDTKQCELPPGRQGLPRACDGQQYPNEEMDRMLPCFASHNGVCRVSARNCHDADG